jgi:adenine-specific DNA-methyltransferase
MDFVVANPPYIRTHDLECDLTGYEFTTEGMKDIYLAFYELGFRMLNEAGRMCYITPSSWFSSLAGQKMRDYVIENRNLECVEDYGHYQLFENATTYVAITVFGKEKVDTVRYIHMDPTDDGDGFWEGSFNVPFDEMNVDGKFYFGTPNQLKQMREISEVNKNIKRGNKPFQVKNGYATLADGVFIEGDVPWAAGDKYVIPATKASTLKWDWCIFPYDDDGNLVSESELEKNAPMEYKLLLEHKDKLLERATEEPWYAYGRTQAIKDTFKEKWAVKSTIKDLSEPICKRVPPGSGVYGGLYILTEHPETLKALETQDFMNYVKLLGKYKSGGYYTFSSKELENYLNWVYGKKED